MTSPENKAAATSKAGHDKLSGASGFFPSSIKKTNKALLTGCIFANAPNQCDTPGLEGGPMGGGGDFDQKNLLV